MKEYYKIMDDSGIVNLRRPVLERKVFLCFRKQERTEKEIEKIVHSLNKSAHL